MNPRRMDKAQGALTAARRTTNAVDVHVDPRRKVALLGAEWPLVCRIERLRVAIDTERRKARERYARLEAARPTRQTV